MLLRDRSGATLAEFAQTDLPNLGDVAWSPVGDRFLFTAGPAEGAALYVYSVKERRQDQVGAGAILEPIWSPDGRWLAFLRQAGLPQDVPQALVANRGSLVVLDARTAFREALVVPGPAAGAAFSPDGRHLAFDEWRKDEFGDYATLALRVADPAAGAKRDVLAGRRKPDWLWAGNDSLAVATYDRYGVPALSLLGLDGRRTRLAATPDYARLRPLEYDPGRERVVYEALAGAASSIRGTLWSVQPGRAPSRLPASDPAYARCAQKE